jgi:hypothetical protein
MSQLTFQLDQNSEKAIEELKEFFGTRSSAAAVRNALALARAIVPAASSERTIVIRDQTKNEDLKILVTG